MKTLYRSALMLSCMVATATFSGTSSAEMEPPMKSWINFFAHSGQWTGKPHVEFIGVVQPSYNWVEDATIEDQFTFQRARLGLRGAATENISYFALYELAHNPPTGPTNGGARLLDAQINLKLSEFANLRVGQFIPDFATAITPGALVHWVDYTDIEKTVYFFNRNGDTETTAAREMGASVWNEFRSGLSSFTYEIGAYNGTGLSQVESTDDDRDVIASLRYAYGPAWIHGGYWTGDRKVGGQDLGKDKWSVALGWGNYVKDKYWIFGEYLDAKQEQTAGPDLESDGFYIAAGWKPTPKTQLTYRYSECDCTDNVGPPGPRDSKVHSIIGEYFIKGNIKVVAQYDIREDDAKIVPGAESDAFRVMLSLPFSYRLTP